MGKQYKDEVYLYFENQDQNMSINNSNIQHKYNVFRLKYIIFRLKYAAFRLKYTTFRLKYLIFRLIYTALILKYVVFKANLYFCYLN